MPADLSGLQVGDTILEINDKKISDFSQLRSIISSNKNIKVTFSRNDKIITNIKTFSGKIGIKGTIETSKLNILIHVLRQFSNFIILLR